MTATFHWHNDRAVHHLLDVLERVNAETPVAKLRWSIAHLNDASPESLRRMKAMGIGWLVQNAFYFRGEAFLGQRGMDVARVSPPIVSALRMGVVVGGGTDAHRVMGPSPFVSLQWMLDGKTVSGVAMRGPEEMPSRLEALRLYTQGSAWFSFEENERGALAPGLLADLAVLSKDYLTVPADEIGSHRLAAHHGRRPCGLCRRAVCRLRGKNLRAVKWGLYGLATVCAPSELKENHHAARRPRSPAAERRPRPVTGTFARNSRRAWACRKDSPGLRRNPSRAGWMRFRHLRCPRQSPTA